MKTPRTRLGLTPGRKIGRAYVVEAFIGEGSEGEVYQLRDRRTGIQRAAKFYYPDVDPKHRKVARHARKLEALRDCPIVLQYHHSEIITVRKRQVVALISELVRGEPLQRWIERHRAGRVDPYVAMQVYYHLIRGLEMIHARGEYHADVHTENILIRPRGVGFDLKLIDFYDWGRPTRPKQKQDITDAVRVFHDMVGGRAHYRRLPPEAKHLCAGLNNTLILKRFPTTTALRRHLETFAWQTTV